MRLLQLSGLLKFNGLLEGQKDAQIVLEDNAFFFLGAGGVITLDNWAEMEDCEKIAFVRAGDRVRDDLAHKTELYRILRKIESIEPAILTSAVEKVCEKLKGRCFDG